MKKVTKILSGLLFSLSLVFPLAACGKKNSNNNNNNLDTDFKKVQKAFNGVENSLKEKKKSSIKRSPGAYYAINEGPSSTLDAINSLFDNKSESRGDTIEDLSYDQPPMIQFQCLKAVFDSIGENFSFSTKYFDTISGDIYFDILTGEDKSAQADDEYRYAYNFTLGLGIKVESDLITADISFDIALHHGENHYSVYWFVKMYLEYDFNSSSPTYTLLMLTDNEQTDLPFRLGCTYEYDYVKVNESKISEWRKFYYEVDQKLFHDSEHPNFDSYKDNVNYSSGYLSWYKNHDYRKIIDVSGDNNLALAKELFALGLNSSDIPKEEYFKQGGTQTSKITEMYRAFSNIFRKDIIYSLVASGYDGPGEEEDEIASLSFFFNGTENRFENCQCSNRDHEITFRDLFISGGKAWGDDGSYPEIYYMDKNGGRIRAESDLNKFRIFVTFGEMTEEVAFDKEVKEIFKGADVDYKVYDFNLLLKLYNNESVQGSMHIQYDYCEPSTDDDDTITSIALEGDSGIIHDGWFSIVDDITVQDIFAPNKTHREYDEDTAEILTVNNYHFVYLNKNNQKISEVSLNDITFGIKDFNKQNSDYMFNETYGNSKISDLWFTINSYIWADGLSVVAVSNNNELDKDQNQCRFNIGVKKDSGNSIPLDLALKNAWPTKPIEEFGLREDFPYVNPSQNHSGEDSDGKYDFYFDSTGSWATMLVRLTSDEYDEFVDSIKNYYGYLMNCRDGDGNLEYIKPERRLTISQDNYQELNHIYYICIYKEPGKMVPIDLSFPDLELSYRDEGYQIGGDIIRVQPLSDDEIKNNDIHVTYWFGTMNVTGQTINYYGTYEIMVEVRYPEDSMFMTRRIVAIITVGA